MSVFSLVRLLGFGFMLTFFMLTFFVADPESIDMCGKLIYLKRIFPQQTILFSATLWWCILKDESKPGSEPVSRVDVWPAAAGYSDFAQGVYARDTPC